MKKMLQNELPKNQWIVKDTKRSLLSDCEVVNLPLSDKDELVMKKMIDWVRASQEKEMNEKLKLTEAIGIAAPQIGVNVNMYYILLPILNHEKNEVSFCEYAMINPIITSKSLQKAALKYGEGCLSVEHKHEGLVKRSYKIQVSGYNYLTRKNVFLTLRSYEAIVFQHEQDHLEKKLYYHHIDEKNPWNKDQNLILISND